MAKKELSWSNMNYLLSISRLKEQNVFTREVDIANDLHVSKPSVTRAIKKLIQLGLIKKDAGGMLCLTARGTRTVQSMSGKLKTVKRFLNRTVESEYKCPENELMKIAYAISDRTYKQLKTYC